MRQSLLRFAGMVASVSLLAGSTAAVAATSPAAVAVASPAAGQVNPWGALAVLSGGASVVAYCGAAAAAQVGTGCVLPQVDAPVVGQSLPPPLPTAAGFRVNPLFILLGLLAAGGLAYLLLHNNNRGNSPR